MANKIDKINITIDKTNGEFKKATKAQKRVMIAQDVLDQIRAKRYVAASGTWVSPTWQKGAADKLSHDDSVQKLFENKTLKKCNVCALGGLFMSCTVLNNKTKVEDLDDVSESLGDCISNDEYKMSNGLKSFFSYNQLILIERYFEGNNGWFVNYDNDVDHIEEFNEKYPDDMERLKKIMKNIVENNGTFVPEKLKV